MRIHPIPAALLLACACAPAAAAQNEVVRPGSAAVRTEGVDNTVDEFDVVSGDGQGEPIGRMTIRTRLVPMGGAGLLVRTETIWMGDEVVQVDSFTLDRQTLAPFSMHSSSGESAVRLEFSPGSVRRVEDGDWGADTSDVPLPEPVFPAGITDLLLGALALRPGYVAELAVYDAQDGIDTITIEVEAMEDVPVPGGSVSAWRVAVTEGVLVSTYWMDRESHRLVQFESADGSLRIVRSGGIRSRARPTR
jgi:hypothetical protein